jgi:hypothetical protein
MTLVLLERYHVNRERGLAPAPRGVLPHPETFPTRVTKTDLQITQCVFLIGAAYGFWQLISLLRRARGKSLTEGKPEACAAFYQSELKRQRNSYRRSAVWVPLAFSALWVAVLLLTQQFMAIVIVIWILFVPFWAYQNMGLARRSQRELDELNASFR